MDTTITADQLPAALRFEVPRYHQGQMIEVAYADHCSRGRYYEYCRVIDRSANEVTYSRKYIGR